MRRRVDAILIIGPAPLEAARRAKFDLALNLKTADAIGLTVPHALMVRADEVIR